MAKAKRRKAPTALGSLPLYIRLLDKYYPNPKCALNYETPLQLLVATILSAQCTDERVNKVTPPLFAKYPDAKAFAGAQIKDLEKLIHSAGFYKNKAKNIKACCQAIVERHGGEVPQDLQQLVALAGVGRKTAHVVLGNAYGLASGVVVDTHVTRLSNRMGLVTGTNAVPIERELNKAVEQKYWINFSHWLILHGRQVCKARSPNCAQCFLQELCPQKI